MQLRPYQRALVDQVREEYRAGARSVVMQLATGGGKTATAAELIALSVAKGRRVVFAAHLDALLEDTSERLAGAGIAHGIVQADRPTNATAPVQVCSLATLHRRGEAPPADLLILDECRRAAASGVRGVLERYPLAHLLGLDATPERGDGQPLGDVFERMVCGPSLAELTAAGYLVPAVVLSPPAPTEGALAMDPVEAYEQHAAGSRALIFCTTVAEAVDVARRLPVPSQTVLGETARDIRLTVRDRVTLGELRVLVGCSAFLEGFDLPAIETVILARAFGTCSSFLQGVGRGLRPWPATGKRECLVLDLTGAAVMHGLPADDRVWSLEGAAVQRTGEGLAPLARCSKCYAVYHAGPASCPRCGAAARGTRLPRRATRIERQTLERLDTRPPWERDEMAVRAIAKRLPHVDRRTGRRLSDKEIAARARFAFKKAHGRSPERRPAEAGGEAA